MRARVLCATCCSLVIVLAAPAAADPGMGAYVDRFTGDDLYWGAFLDEDEYFLLLISNSEIGLETFFCGETPDGENLPFYDMAVTQPDGSIKFLEQASAYGRLYAGEGVVDEFEFDRCGFLTTGPQVAEGIVSYVFNDNDATGSGPGRNVWGFNVGGSLYDLSGLCPGGIAHLQVVRKFKLDSVDADWPACWPDCVQVQVFKGPRLSCKAY